MRPRLLLTSCLYAVAGARRPPPTDAITQKHVGDNQLNAYAIGAGFEGSASDWTEYVVWTQRLDRVRRLDRRRRGLNFLPERRREDRRV